MLSLKISDQSLVALLIFGTNGLNVVAGVIREADKHARTGLELYAGVTWVAMLAILFACVLVQRLEVRDRGILLRSRLISWLNIERYEWEPSRLPGDLTSLSIARVPKGRAAAPHRQEIYIPAGAADPRRVPAKTAGPLGATTNHRVTHKDRFAGLPSDFAPLPYAPPRPFPPEMMRFTSASLSTTTPKNGDIISSQLISP